MKPKNTLPPWLRPKNTQAQLRVSVGWYTPEEWAKVKAAATDPELFEPTFAEWEAMAEESLANIRAQGIDAQKSFVNASDLLAWCLIQGKENNSASRAEFVSRS